MKTFDKRIALAKETFQLESEAVKKLADRDLSDFPKIVEAILNTEGRVLITGIGKSAIIGQKIVSTLNSTGTPAIFMHAADAIHGDLGNVRKGDIVIAISNSGTTPEVKVLIPMLRNLGNPLVGMVGDVTSHLALKADMILDTTVDQEACPNDLAPTSSTLAQMAMGDALAVTLMDQRGFSPEDFAKYHPGGALGKKLYLTLGDFVDKESAPAVAPEDDLNKVIFEISSKRLGATAVLNEKKEVIGIITDGDLRRMLEQSPQAENITAEKIMTREPKTLSADSLAVKAFQLMEQNSITQVLVTDDGKYAGTVHLHDILKEGIY